MTNANERTIKNDANRSDSCTRTFVRDANASSANSR